MNHKIYPETMVQLLSTIKFHPRFHMPEDRTYLVAITEDGKVHYPVLCNGMGTYQLVVHNKICKHVDYVDLKNVFAWAKLGDWCSDLEINVRVSISIPEEKK